jgi:hypothetical protein
MQAACSAPSAGKDPAAAGPAPVAITSTSQPANVGDAKRAARAYHDSGAYARDLAAVATEARSWLSERAPQVSRPALVLDIDETALSNWEVIQRDDFGRIIGGPCRALPEGPCGWAAWDLLGRDPALEPTLRLFQLARGERLLRHRPTGSAAGRDRAQPADRGLRWLRTPLHGAERPKLQLRRGVQGAGARWNRAGGS